MPPNEPPPTELTTLLERDLALLEATLRKFQPKHRLAAFNQAIAHLHQVAADLKLELIDVTDPNTYHIAVYNRRGDQVFPPPK